MVSVTEQNSENLSPEELKENKDRELQKHKKKENHNRRPSSGGSISSSYSESSSSSESEPRKKKKNKNSATFAKVLRSTCVAFGHPIASENLRRLAMICVSFGQGLKQNPSP